MTSSAQPVHRLNPAASGLVRPEADDAGWFTSALEPLLAQLYATARRLTKNAADAEDLVADSVARAWQARNTLADRALFRAWIYRILTNVFTSAWRTGRVRPAEERLDEGDDRGDADFSLFERLHQPFLLWWGTPEQEYLNKLLRQDLERAIDALPEAFRVAVTLADVQGLSYQEIADAIQVPIGTVRSRLARGRALLQKALWQHGLDAGLVKGESPTARGTT